MLWDSLHAWGLPPLIAQRQVGPLNDGFGPKLSIKLIGTWWSVFGRTRQAQLLDFCVSNISVLALLLSALLVSSRSESWFMCILFWCIDESEVLPADKVTFTNHSRT